MTTEKKNTPAYNIYTTIPCKEKGTKLGSKIGVAWNFKSGKEGFRIVLDAMPLPINGRLELIAFKPKSKS